MFILCCDTVTKVFASVKKLWKISFKIIMYSYVCICGHNYVWLVCLQCCSGRSEKVQVCGAKSASSNTHSSNNFVKGGGEGGWFLYIVLGTHK